MDSDNLDRSAPNIHSYGYDVHEVHTSGQLLSYLNLKLLITIILFSLRNK